MPENTTPDTLSYLILGLVVAFGILAAYIGSLVVRYRNLQKDIQLLEQLDE
jgi:hypothetical protein